MSGFVSPNSSSIERLRTRIATLATNETYRFDPPLDEATVRAAEESLGIVFPEEYRNFLREVASGHGGRFQIALRVAEADDRIRQSFPFTWEEAQHSPLSAPSVVGGTFVVWDQGCGEESHLVITGAERGQVWRCHEDGWRPDGDPEVTTPLGYLAWLEWWLTVW
jgi:hypothetical protein